jgi:hypothetical protein
VIGRVFNEEAAENLGSVKINRDRPLILFWDTQIVKNEQCFTLFAASSFASPEEGEERRNQTSVY